MARDQMTQGEVEALINELEQKLSRLRAIYEQYFMGIERTPPTTLRKDVVRLVHTLENVYVRNTAVKFKIRSMVQRFNSYKTYWNRVERQIEEGTYVRDIRRAERNRDRRRQREDAARERQPGGADDDGILEIDFEDVVDLGDLQAELEEMEKAGAFDRGPNEPQMPAAADASPGRKQQKLAEIASQLGIDAGQAPTNSTRPDSSGPKPSASEIRGRPASTGRQQKPGSAGSAPATSLSERRQKLTDIKKKFEERTGRTVSPAASSRSDGDDARRVYDQLLEAKRRCNESTNGLSYEAVARSMKKQRDTLKQKRGASDVEFKVVIKDGRAFLKPETK